MLGETKMERKKGGRIGQLERKETRKPEQA